MKKTLVILGMMTALSLSACSHKNPMETEPKEETAKFLVQASTYAEIKINYQIKHHGITYAGCMQKRYGSKISKADCEKLYNYIIEYARQSNTDYENITYEDLTNKQVFDAVHDEYSRIYFEEEAVNK